MKIVGIIGGMSWESTQHYYRFMNQDILAQLGRGVSWIEKFSPMRDDVLQCRKQTMST
jgi:aspartate/glutamate racemase